MSLSRLIDTQKHLEFNHGILEFTAGEKYRHILTKDHDFLPKISVRGGLVYFKNQIFWECDIKSCQKKCEHSCWELAVVCLCTTLQRNQLLRMM